MASARASALRALAARLGPALRFSRRSLNGYDAARFLEPIADVLKDVGDTLHAYMLQDSEAGNLGYAPAHVSQEVQLLRAVAVPAPVTPPTSSAGPLTSPTTPCKLPRALDLAALLPVPDSPVSSLRATKCVSFAETPPDVIEFSMPPAGAPRSPANAARRRRMKNMKEGFYRQIQFFEKRTSDDSGKIQVLREQLEMTKADLLHRSTPGASHYMEHLDLCPSSAFDHTLDGENDGWIGFFDHDIDFLPPSARDREPGATGSQCSMGLPPPAQAPSVPLPDGPFVAEVGTVAAEIRRYVLFGTLDESSACVGDLRRLLAEHLPQFSITEDVLRRAMIEVFAPPDVQLSQRSPDACALAPEPTTPPAEQLSLEERLRAAFEAEDFEAMHELYKPAKRDGASKRLLRKVRHLLDVDLHFSDY